MERFSPERLRTIRKSKGYSLRDLYEEIVRRSSREDDIPKNHTNISNWENGKHVPHLNHAAAAAIVLDCKVDDFLEEKPQ